MITRILLGADLVPTTSNYKYFNEGDVDQLLGRKLHSLLQSADFTIFNLEVPLTDTAAPIEKNGPNLIAPTSMIAGLQAINPHFFTLANNHILDQGTQGLRSTIRVLDEAGIRHAGAGENLTAAARAHIEEINGIRVGIYCCAEHEFTIAGDDEPGANPFDPLDSLDHVSELRGHCDYLIVLYHGGKEYYRYPSPYLQRVCRKLVDKGADLVVCQHSHCVGACETWPARQHTECESTSGIINRHYGTIIYGQGNFLFDNDDSECWQTSLLIELELDKKNISGADCISSQIRYIPLQKSAETVRIAEGQNAERILSDFEKRSEEAKDPALMDSKYRAFAASMIEGYLNAFAGRRSFLSKVLNKLSGHRLHKWRISRKYGGRERTVIQNFVECEAHRELVLKGLKARK